MKQESGGGGRPYPQAMRLGMLIAGVLPLVAVCRGQSIADVGTARATRAVVTLGEGAPDIAAGAESDMTLRLKGVLAQLQGKALNELRACIPAHPFLGEPRGAEPVCTIHLYAGSKSRRLNVVHTADGAYIAIDPDASKAGPVRAELRADKFAVLTAAWPAYRGGFESDALKDPKEEVFTLPKPYAPGRFTIDLKTIGERFLNGGTSTIPGTDRVLDNETLYCRVPKEYSPRRPAGLLVWISPMSDGKPPEALWPAADELDLIIVGAADSGNTRLVSNREQLALDGVATAMQRYHIDPRRVYVTGLSGGGRVATMMAVCFPDVFTGCVPIAGLASYDVVPNGMGQFWASSFSKPRSDVFRVFRMRRIAPITGRGDSNQLEIENAADLMQRDGVHIKVFDYKDQGHSLPTSARMADALKWVDGPADEQHAAEAAEAQRALDGYIARFGSKPPSDESVRKMLVKVTEAGPWTEAAWKAVDMLSAK